MKTVALGNTVNGKWMFIFKTKWFSKWAQKEQLNDATLTSLVAELENGRIDADLGGQVFKKRVAIAGVGKRSGVRTLIAFKSQKAAFFIYGFSKNMKSNVTEKELKALKRLAKELLNYDKTTLMKASNNGSLIPVNKHEK